MKKIFFAFALLGLASLAFSQATAGRKYAVVLKTANVRSQPTTQASILFVAQPGERLEVLDDLGTWIKVRRKDGTIGYLWAKLARIEIERIISPSKAQTPSQPKATVPPSATTQSSPHTILTSERRKFALSFNFSYAFVDPKEFNANSEYINGFLKEWKAFFEDLGASTRLGEPLKGMKNLLGGGLEARFMPVKNLGIGLGFSMFSGKAEGKGTLTIESGGSEEIYFNQNRKATIYAPYFSLHFLYPSPAVTLDAFAGAGYFMGNFSEKFDYEFMGPGYWTMDNIKKSSLGFLGGLGLEFNLSQNIGLFLQGKYFLAKFKDMEGDFKNDRQSLHGDVYYMEVKGDLGWYPLMSIFETPPSPSSNQRNIKKAEFDFSGFYLGAGLVIKF